MNLEGRIIGVDWDGCVASGASLKVRLAKELFGVQMAVEQSAEDVFSRLYGKEIYRKLMDVVGKMTEQYQLLPYCREALLLLQQEGAKSVVITSRADDEVAAARAFNLKHGVPISDIYNTMRRSKREIVLRLNPAAYIDDSLWKLVELEGTDTSLYFLSQDWNRHEHGEAIDREGRGILAVVSGWQQFYSRLTGREFPSVVGHVS